MKVGYKNILLFISGVLLLYLNFWGIDRLVLGSDELHPTRALISDDWSIQDHPWPEEGIREYYDNWPIQFPPIFGLMVRASIVLIGGTHLALRLVPALFSLLAIFAFYGLFKQFLNNTRAAALAILLGMSSDKVLVYAKSLKHYTLDIFFTALLLMLGIKLGQKNDLKAWLLYTFVAVISIWFGFASIYVVASVYVYLFVRYVWFKAFRGQQFWARFILSGLLFTASFIGLYFTTMVRAVNNPVLLRDWSVMIFDWTRLNDTPFVIHYILHVGKHVLILPAYFFHDQIWVAVVADLLILVWIIDRFRAKAWDQVVLLVMPLVMVVLASIAGRYPFGAARTTLYLVPAWTLMITLGAFKVYEYLKTRQMIWARLAVGAAALVVLWGIWLNIYNVYRLDYAGGRHVDKLMATMKENARDGDTAYLDWGAIQAFYIYYTDRNPGYQSTYSTPADSGNLYIIYGEEHTFHPELYEPHYQRIESTPGRLWVVFGHLWPYPTMLDLKARLDAKRDLLQEWDFKGCKLLLYAPLSTDKEMQQPDEKIGG